MIDFILIDSRAHEEEEEPEENAENENEEVVVANGDNEKREPEALLVLAEEELVAIDLKDEGWKMMSLPYLVSLHASAVTCTQYVSGIVKKIFQNRCFTNFFH